MIELIKNRFVEQGTVGVIAKVSSMFSIASAMFRLDLPDARAKKRVGQDASNRQK